MYLYEILSQDFLGKPCADALEHRLDGGSRVAVTNEQCTVTRQVTPSLLASMSHLDFETLWPCLKLNNCS